MELLLGESGADVNIRDISESPLLHEAVGSGNFDIAQLLISHGADVNVLDLQGNSSLYSAFTAIHFMKLYKVGILTARNCSLATAQM